MDHALVFHSCSWERYLEFCFAAGKESANVFFVWKQIFLWKWPGALNLGWPSHGPGSHSCNRALKSPSLAQGRNDIFLVLSFLLLHCSWISGPQLWLPLQWLLALSVSRGYFTPCSLCTLSLAVRKLLCLLNAKAWDPFSGRLLGQGQILELHYRQMTMNLNDEQVSNVHIRWFWNQKVTLVTKSNVKFQQRLNSPWLCDLAFMGWRLLHVTSVTICMFFLSLKIVPGNQKA